MDADMDIGPHLASSMDPFPDEF